MVRPYSNQYAVGSAVVLRTKPDNRAPTSVTSVASPVVPKLHAPSTAAALTNNASTASGRRARRTSAKLVSLRIEFHRVGDARLDRDKFSIEPANVRQQRGGERLAFGRDEIVGADAAEQFGGSISR